MKNHIDRFAKLLNDALFAESAQEVIDSAIAIQQIPAPTFHEKERAEYVKSLFQSLDLQEVDMDDVFNVYGVIHGKDRTKLAIMVSAHTDTVFSPDDDLTIRRDGEHIFGPGLGDNSMGVAGMLGMINILKKADIVPESDIWFVATTGEEGLGDLGGMRAAFNRLKSKVRAVINIEGLAFGYIYHAGIAVRRLRITAQAEGGHSWLHFGRASAINGIVQLGYQITKISPPTTPRTTYNIGLIEGGQSINTIAPTASLWLDMRSEDRNTLDALDSEIRRQIGSANTSEIRFTIDVVGDRPSGKIPIKHPLIKGAQYLLESMHIRPVLESGSTDGNIPLSEDCPTITIGITRGGNAHRKDEFIETSPVKHGMRQLVILTLAATASDNI